MHILILEDNPGDVALATAMLEEAYEGPRLEYAQTLADAVGLQAAVGLVDLNVPDSRGLDTVRGLLGLGIPLIALTGAADDTIGPEAIRAGAADFLSKDELNPRVLRRAIDYALARHELEADLSRAKAELEDP